MVMRISKDFIADLEARLDGFPVPPPDQQPFDASKASPELLKKYGLPPKPNARKQKAVRRAWDKGFGKPLKLQAFKFQAEQALDAPYRPRRRESDSLLFAPTRVETSANWSGAYITANDDRQFMQIWGSWKVPANLKMPAPLLQGPADLPYSCSNWIGLDGQRLYFDSSLPQMGTASVLEADGSTSSNAWMQWWARGNLATLPVPMGLPVNPGDEVLCILTATDPQTVIGVMVNLTSLTAVAVEATAPTVNGAQPSIAGATAEWIVERPTLPPPDPAATPPPLENFPNYGVTRFDFCIAVEAASVNIAALSGGVPQCLQSPRIIRMFATLLNPARTVYTSMPAKLNDTSLRLKYGGF